MKRLFLLISLCFGSFLIHAQSTADVCVCCNQFYPRSGYDYDEVFEPFYIVGKNIHIIDIMVTSRRMKIKGRDTSYEVLHEKYPIASYEFNAQGYLVARKEYGEFGKIYAVYRYLRDEQNRILSTQGYYPDSNGIEILMGGSHEDFTWDRGNLVKIKNRAFDNITILPDEKSYYKTFSYDALGRLKGQVDYWYFDEKDISRMSSVIEYAADKRSSVERTRNEGKLFTIKKTVYNTIGAPVSEKLYDAKNKLLQEIYFSYDAEGRIVTSKTKMYPGMGTECPDKGNTINKYYYHSDGFYDKVVQRYGNIICEMQVEYQ